MTKPIPTCEYCGHQGTIRDFVMANRDGIPNCVDMVKCTQRKGKAMKEEEKWKIHVPEDREYIEATLHFKGGTVVVACVREISSKTDGYGHYTSLSWQHTKWDDLPKLSSIALSDLQAISTKTVRETV